jgi:hypothetical protein
MQKSWVKNPVPLLPWTPPTHIWPFEAFGVVFSRRPRRTAGSDPAPPFSYIRTSKISVGASVAASVRETVRHSMLKIRSGALPETEVKIPQPVQLSPPQLPGVLLGAQVRPQREDGEVIRSKIRRRRQTGADVTARVVDRHEVQAPIGADVHAVIGLIV